MRALEDLLKSGTINFSDPSLGDFFARLYVNEFPPSYEISMSTKSVSGEA